MSNLALQDIVFDAIGDKAIFHIVGDTIELFNSYTSYGWKTVAIYAKKYYHFNDEYISLETAIDFWEYINNRTLTPEELSNVIDSHYGR